MTLIAATLLAMTGCDRSGPTTATSAREPALSLRQGARPFAFDYETVTELLIVKSDPASGDRWSARLTRPDAKSGHWSIRSEGGKPLSDAKADGYFVLHLLDTLRTLQVAESPVPGPETSLGLEPPRFALSWLAASSEGPRRFELKLGAMARDKGHAYASIPGQAPFVAEGASLQMLDYIQSFESLRMKNWTGILADDVDEIELKQRGRTVFYAQREGADWADRARRPSRRDVGTWLTRLTHERVLRFVDDPEEASPFLKLGKLASSAIEREAVLTDRKGRATRLRIVRSGRRLIGLSDARPGGVFEIYPEGSRALEPPGK